MVDVAQNEKIRIFSYSEVTDVQGFVGNFEVVKCEFFNFVFLKDYFGFSGSLELYEF